MTEASNEALNNVLSQFDLSVQEIAQAARAIIYDVLPQVVEIVWERQKMAGYGTGPKKMSEHFCWIAPYKKHVVLGFNYGAELPDPEDILTGTGKLFRHVRLASVEDVQQSGIRTLIQVATTHRVPPPNKEARE